MKKKKERSPLRMLALISQLGICMLTAIFFCVFLGRYLVSLTGLDWLFPLMLLLGVLAGIRSCYNIIRRFVDLRSSASLYTKRYSKEQLCQTEEDDFDRS